MQIKPSKNGYLPLNLLRRDFIGLDTQYPLIDGRITRRHYLDSAASTLAMGCARQIADDLLRHYANTHSELHFSARIVSHAYSWAHQQVLDFVNADPQKYTAFFAGNGCTAPLNRLAQTLAAQRPERDTVLISLMEHHANDLPHRKYARTFHPVPLAGETPALGTTDLSALAQLLKQYHGQVNYIAISAASNVTGIINPVHDIAQLAHAHDVRVVVDASQYLAHAPLALSDTGAVERELDAVVFSGHKLYAPGSPGVAIVRQELLENSEPDELGGGMVEDVTLHDYQVSHHFPDREEAGTPNIIGAVQLAAVLNVLQRIGMKRIHAAEHTTLALLLDGLSTLPGVRIYGDPDLHRTPRLGTVAFNLDGLEHGLVAAILNDHFNVAVRDGCFCAHPYVRELLKPELWRLDIDPDAENAATLTKPWQGMVRASLGLYTDKDDINSLLESIRAVLARPQHYREQYVIDSAATFHHRHPNTSATTLFDPVERLDRALERLSATNDML